MINHYREVQKPCMQIDIFDNHKVGHPHVIIVLSQFVDEPLQEHMDVTMCVLAYLKMVLAKGITFQAHEDFTLKSECDTELVG